MTWFYVTIIVMGLASLVASALSILFTCAATWYFDNPGANAQAPWYVLWSHRLGG